MFHLIASLPGWVFMVAIGGLIAMSLMRVQDERREEREALK